MIHEYIIFVLTLLVIMVYFESGRKISPIPVHTTYRPESSKNYVQKNLYQNKNNLVHIATPYSDNAEDNVEDKHDLTFGYMNARSVNMEKTELL